MKVIQNTKFYFQLSALYLELLSYRSDPGRSEEVL
jgi:hypothetical protein